MPKYQVNVRAVVRAKPSSPDTPGHIEGWDVYDHDQDADGTVTMRCDQAVSVEADDQDAAIKAAKADATSIVLGPEWEVDSVNLWVDEGIDVELAPPSPAP